MILQFNHLQRKPAAATSQDVVDVLYGLLEEGHIEQSQFARLRVHLDWIQYRHNFREPVTIMQAGSDLFLGWTVGMLGHHFYVRQLRDMKVKPLTELFTPSTMRDYAKFCGWTLAQAHARSGSPALIGGYLGKSQAFDEALTDFAVAYADQNERDWQALKKAVRDGRIKVQTESSEG